MTPVFIYAILYTVAIRTPVVCGSNIHGSPNVTFHCFETQGQSHFVEIDDEKKAIQFVANLKPYNHAYDLENGVPDNTRFILGLTAQTYTKIDGKWTMINEHKVGDTNE
jgi:hypothetical protein